MSITLHKSPLLAVLLAGVGFAACTADSSTTSGEDSAQSQESLSRPVLTVNGPHLQPLTSDVLPRAAGPRTRDLHEIKIILRNHQELDRVARGFDITTRKGSEVTVYATDQEAQVLHKGFLVVSDTPVPRTTVARGQRGLGVYHTHATVGQDLAAYAAAYPNIARLTTIGNSYLKRPIWALQISDHVGVPEGEPEVLFSATIHGDEIVGTEMTLYFIHELLSNYGSDPRITHLVDQQDIWIIPVTNPDGYEAGERYNAQGIDLNRSFPDGSMSAIGNVFDGPAMGLAGRPTEVVALMTWRAAHSFEISANFHGGAVVVNYPYDNDGLGSVFSPSPDEPLFQVTSRAYSIHNHPMWNSNEFTDGVTNGAAWYTLEGGMQDWSYRYTSCNDFTIELSDDKQPSVSTLPTFWGSNREAMLSYLETAFIGVHGRVTDANTGLPVRAAISVQGNAHPVYSAPAKGDYHRQLLPGTYTISARAPGYTTTSISNVVVSASQPTDLNISLPPVK